MINETEEGIETERWKPDLQIAPMQGYTQAAWRHFRRKVYGGIYQEYTPFLRIERGAVRMRDLRDYTSPLNEGSLLTPQIIFSDLQELDELVATVTGAGATHIDLNLGCPYPPQVHHGRGAGMLVRPDMLRETAAYIADHSDITFSVKMRLGTDSPDQWRDIYGIINDMPLEHVTVHPRTARQQYRGELWLDEFRDLLSVSEHPVVYNGDILTPADIDAVTTRFPSVYAVMAGRGLCARPSLFTEYMQGREWDSAEQIARMLRFHDLLLQYYKELYDGSPNNVLQHIRPFWDYAEPLIGHRAFKAIRKASGMSRYEAAVAMVRAL